MLKNLAIIFISLILSPFFAGCGKSSSEIKEEEAAAKELIKEQNSKAVHDMSNRYNAYMGLDTIEYYTYVYQDLFLDQGRLLSFEGELNDIKKTDSTYVLNVIRNDWKNEINYIAQISISLDQFIKFKRALDLTRHSTEGCYIFKVTKVFPASPKIIMEIDSNEEGLYSYLDYDFDERLIILKGELVDYYLNKTYASSPF